MKRVFISYRRADSIVYGELIYRRLVEQFGASNVFFDKEEIDLGAEFARIIEERVGSCDVLLAVIGPKWLTMVDDSGRRRLDQPDDYVRYEIAVALSRNILVIPTLVGEARVPRKEELPQDIAALADRNAQDIRDASLDPDIEHLIARLLKHKSFGSAFNALTRRLRLHRLTRVIVPVCVLVMFFAAWVQLFDWLTLDTKIESYTMWLGGLFTQPAPSSDIALVAINEATFRRLNKPLEKMSLDPTWRREHARLIETLSRAGARTVAFDVFLKESSSYDEELIAAIVAAKSRNTAVVFVTRGEPLPIAGLENAAFGLACIGARIGYAPVAPLAVQEKPGLAAFALMAAHPGGKIKRIDRKNREITLLTADEELKTIRYSDDELMSSSQRSCPVLEGAKVALLFIDFSPLESWRDTARRFRYEEVVAAAVANGTEQFKGKVVLVGHETERDTLSFFQGFRREERYGFEVHADALSTVLRGVHIRPLDPVGQWLIMLGMGALGAAAQVLPQLNTPIKRRIYRFGAVAAYLVLTVLLYVKYQFLLNTLYHIAAFFFADWTTGKAKRRLGLSESG